MIIDSLRLRHSVRTFSPEPLNKQQINSLKAAITDVNTHEYGMRFLLVTDSRDALGSFKSSYGMFKNANNYIAGIVDTSYSDYVVRGGYFGMKLMMHACNIGLGTCFISATFSRSATEKLVRPGEKLLFVIAIGKERDNARSTLIAAIATKFAHLKKGLTPMDFLDTTLPSDQICAAFPNLLVGLEAVSYAPSAYNKQPVGILIKKADDSYNPLETTKKKNKKLKHEEELSKKYAQLLHSDTTPTAPNPTNPTNPKTNPQANPQGNSQNNPQNNTNDIILQAYVPGKNTNQLLDLGIAMFSFQAVYPGTWQWGNPATFTPD